MVAPASARRRILATALSLLGAGNVLVNRVLPARAYPIVNGATAALLLRLARRAGAGPAALGLDRRHCRRSALVGLAGAGLVAGAYGIALAVPSLRTAFDDDRLGDVGLGGLLWVTLVRIPVGTVLLEEVAFRAVLPALLGGDDRWGWGSVLGSSALFGLWHVLPSMELGRNAAVDARFGDGGPWMVPGLAVGASAAAGVVLHGLRHAGRGLLAPALVHAATNSGGAVVAWRLRRNG
jgi:CAAX protease family protein